MSEEMEKHIKKTLRRIILIMIVSIIIFGLYNKFPAIVAAFDDVKYVDGEVFTPQDNLFDFKYFTIYNPHTRNYTAVFDRTGFVQIHDGNNHTINIFEWTKFNSIRKNTMNGTFDLELQRPYHVTDGIRVIEIDFLGKPFYGAYKSSPDRSMLVYITTASENETLDLIKSLKFKEELF